MSLIRGRPEYVSPENLAQIEDFRKKARSSRRKFIEKFLWIKDAKKRRLVPFRFNRSQEILWAIIEQMIEDPDRAARAIILKGRQVGSSTLCAALTFAEVYNNDQSDALVLAHLKERTIKLFQMHHLFLKMLPSDLQMPLARSSRMELHWEHSNSGISLATAGTTSFGRGGTVPIVHASEAAFYPSLYETLGALEPSIPDEPTTIFLLETTAEGVGTEFNHLWEAAKKREVDFEAIFLPWFQETLLRRRFLTKQAEEAWKEAFLDDELQARQEHYGLSVEQIHWYWWWRKNKCNNDELRMMTEYPCDDQECFIAAGTPVFPVKPLQEFRLLASSGKLYDPLKSWTSINELTAKEDAVERDRDSYVEIWDTPTSKSKYVIGADCSEGLPDGDYSCAYVCELATRRVVATLHGRMAPHEFARQLAKLGRAYNDAVIAPEAHGIGVAVLARLQEIYHNIYQWRQFNSAAGGVQISNQLGWETSISSRPFLLSQGREMLNDKRKNAQFIPDIKLIEELQRFVYTGPNMKAQAGHGHDDRVMAWLITQVVCEQEANFTMGGGIIKAKDTEIMTAPYTIDEMIAERRTRGGIIVPDTYRDHMDADYDYEDDYE